jgi:hypothetical protein
VGHGGPLLGVQLFVIWCPMAKPSVQMPNEIEFMADLRSLLDKYDVDLVASDDGASYGQQLPLIQIQFNDPYSVYEFAAISSADEVEEDVRFKVSK